MTQRYKDFPPGWHHLRIPVTSRRSALAALAMYAACRPTAIWAQRVAWAGVWLAGPRILPGRAVPWVPLGDVAWSELMERLRAELPAFDTVAGYQRSQPGRGGCSLLLMRRDQPVAFLKLACSDDGAPSPAEHALAIMRRSRVTAFLVPQVLSGGALPGWRYFATTPLPSRLHRPPNAPPLDVIAREIDAALAALPRPAHSPSHWRPMHGDLTPWNLRQSGRQLFLVDWEQCGWGPPGADVLLYRVTDAVLRGGREDGSIARTTGVETVEFWRERIDAKWRGGARDDRFVTAILALLRRIESAARETGGEDRCAVS